MGRKPTFKKEKKLPQAQSAEEIEARDRQEEAKQRSRAGRRVDCDDKPKKKKAADDSSEESSDDDSDFGFDEGPASEEEESEEEEERAAKPKNLLDQLGVQLEGATNLNVAAKDEKKAVKMKDMKMSMASEKPELSRREREELEAKRKEAAYRKKHEAGETDEAKSDLARLAEVRKRREDAKKAKEAQAAADEAKAEEKKVEVKKSAKVELVMPTQKEVKSALLKMKDACNPDFQKKHKLDSLSGNKLAKMKYSDFTKIWNDFVASCSEKEHAEFAA